MQRPAGRIIPHNPAAMIVSLNLCKRAAVLDHPSLVAGNDRDVRYSKLDKGKEAMPSAFLIRSIVTYTIGGNMRTRFLGRVMSVLAVLGLAGLLAAPVFAISSITNDLTVTPRTFGDSVTVDVVATTLYDQWWLPPTVYPSNFVIAMNYRHLRSPSIYYRNGPNGSFAYRSSIGEINGNAGYWFDNGGGWFGVPVTYTLKYTMTSPTSCPSSQANHWHGQTEFANSKGNPVIVTSTHTSC